MTQQRHKHYQQLRALADGWEVEWLYSKEAWSKTPHPSEHENAVLIIKPDAEGWLPWYATEDSQCPVDWDTIIDVEVGYAIHCGRRAVGFDWSSEPAHQIRRYRIVKKNKTPRAKRTLVKTIKVFSDGSTEEG